MNLLEQTLQRPEWKPEQRQFLRDHPALAALCERHLQTLDAEIAYYEKRQHENPFYWLRRLFKHQ